jgi:hypothetical protein
MPQKNKLLVFLSSALDDDIRVERAAVKVAIDLRSYSAEFVGVERWSAGGASPRDNSLDKLADCDVYVGVFGRRCGEVTLQEYEAAKLQSGMTLLLFFRKLGLNETSNTTDVAGKERVDLIRKDVNSLDAPTWVEYTDPMHLRALVGEAIDAERERRERPRSQLRTTGLEPRKILATLCDRDDQQPGIDRLLNGALRDGQHPLLIYGLYGADEEDHEAFVEWYHHLRLHAEYATEAGSAQARSDAKRKDIVKLEWRVENASLEDRFMRLLRDVTELFVDPRSVPATQPELIGALAQSLNGAGQHITMRYHLRSGDARGDDDKLLKRWLETLLALPLVTAGSVVTVFFCFRRQASRLSWLAPGARRLQQSFDLIRDWSHPSVIALPELASPTRNHAVGWAETRCLKYYRELDRDVLMKHATAPFGEKNISIPFSNVKPELEEALMAAHRAYRADGDD